MRLSGGDSVLIHLGMSGRMNLTLGIPNTETAHEHVVIEVDDGWRVGFVDPRRFGSVDLVKTEDEDQHRLLDGMGPEPLSDAFSVAMLNAVLAGKRTPIKAALLDQRIVAGLGNIYVCEALFRARISPARLASSVAGARAARLVPEIKATLDGGSDRRRRILARGITSNRTANWAISNTPGRSTGGRASGARSVQASPDAPACGGWCNRDGVRFIAGGCSGELMMTAPGLRL